MRDRSGKISPCYQWWNPRFHGIKQHTLALMLVVTSGAILIACAGPTNSGAAQPTASATATRPPQPGCTETAAAPAQETCILPSSETVLAPRIAGYEIDVTRARQTGEIMYKDVATGRDYFAWDQHALLIDADGNTLATGLLLLTLDGAKALDPASATKWKMLPGVQAKHDATLTYHVTPSFQGQEGTTAIVVTGDPFNVVSNNPTTAKAEYGQQIGTQNSYLIWEHPAEALDGCSLKICSSYPAGEYLNALVYGGAPQMPQTKIADPTTFPTLHFGQVIAKGINRAAFFYGPGAKTIDPLNGANKNGGMIKLNAANGQTLYAGGFVLP